MQAEVYDAVASAVLRIRWEVEEAQREVFSRLEDHLEFVRSSVDDLDDVAYRPGPVEEDSIYSGESMYGV